jgi:hypothetical protein
MQQGEKGRRIHAEKLRHPPQPEVGDESVGGYASWLAGKQRPRAAGSNPKELLSPQGGGKERECGGGGGVSDVSETENVGKTE